MGSAPQLPQQSVKKSRSLTPTTRMRESAQLCSVRTATPSTRPYSTTPPRSSVTTLPTKSVTMWSTTSAKPSRSRLLRLNISKSVGQTTRRIATRSTTTNAPPCMTGTPSPLKVQMTDDMKELYHHKPERFHRRDLMRLTWTTKHKWFGNKKHIEKEMNEKKNPREKPFL